MGFFRDGLTATLTIGILLILVVGMWGTVSFPATVTAGLATAGLLLSGRWVAAGVGWGRSAERLVAYWEDMAIESVDAVFPRPRRQRGARADQDGTQGQIVGFRPDRRRPLIAINPHTFAEMCATFDRENAELIETKAAWSARLQRTGSRARGVTAVWLAWFVPTLISAVVLTAPILSGAKIDGFALIFCGLVAVGVGVLFYGIFFAGFGAAAWVRALILSVQAERDRDRAVQRDVQRRDSAAELVAQMQARPTQPQSTTS